MTIVADGLPSVPVLGAVVIWHRDPQWLEYETETMAGLARVSADLKRIDLLVVNAIEPGQGDGSRFIDELMTAYQTVIVWEVVSGILATMLRKRGFREYGEADINGGVETGFRWDRAA